MKVKEIVHYAIDFIFPKRCIICDEVLPFGENYESQHICLSCIKKIDFISKPYCKKCGAKIYGDDEMLCMRCKEKGKSYFDFGFGLCRYNDFIKESLHKIKYKSRREYIEFYAKCITKVYKDELKKLNIEAFLPVPIHKKRLVKRNYNQAEVLAKSLTKNLGYYDIEIPTDTNVVFRNKNTKVLNKLDNLSREKEIKGAFFVNENNYKNVCIIDDIYTTGTTIEEMSKVLKESGVEHIYFICIAVVDNL